MNNFFKTLIAGYGATKLGGGCLSTIVIFVLIYWALGQCNPQAAHAEMKGQATVPAYYHTNPHK